jgi:hypothetical protein
MDGKGLRKYVLEHPNEKKEVMMDELPDDLGTTISASNESF